MTNKITKIAGIMILLGLIITVIGLAATKGDFRGIIDRYNIDDTYTYYEETFEEVITEIKVDSVNRKFVFHATNEDSILITYNTSEKDAITISIEEETLSLKNTVARQVFRLFEWVSPQINEIHIYLPSSYEGSIQLKNTNGKVEIDGFYFLTSLDIQVTNGAVEVKNSGLEESSIIKTTNGSVLVTNTVTVNHLTLQTTNGTLRVEDSTIGGNLQMTSSNGDVRLNNSTCSNVDLRVVNGKITVLLLGNYNDYRYELETVNGKIEINNTRYGSQVLNPVGANILKAKTTNGNVVITVNP